MAHRTERVTFKLNDSLSNGSKNRITQYWMIHSYSLGAHRALNAEPNARSLVCTRRQPIADEIFLKFGSVTVFRVFPWYVYSRTQNSCVFGFPSGFSQRVGQVTWHPLLTWSWTKNRFLQSSENFHPKLILALEVVVGEEKCPFFFFFLSIGMKLSLLIVILAGTLVGSKRQSHNTSL